MVTKTLNTRIKNRLDTLANWKAAGVELLAGEIALVSVTTKQTDSAGNVVNVPAVLMKVGSVYTEAEAAAKENEALAGTIKPFSELPWLSAKAADVYDWAKTAHAKDISVTLVTGTDAQGNDKTEQHSLGEWLEEVISANGESSADLASIKAKLPEDKTVTEAITDAINALNYTDEDTDSGNFVKAVTQTNGIVSVTKGNITEDDLPTIYASNIIVTDATESSDAVTVASKLEAIDTAISGISNAVSGGVHFIGIVSAKPTGGTVTIGTSTVTVKAGDVVIYKDNTGTDDVDEREFIYTGSDEDGGHVWEELGDITRIGRLEKQITDLDVTDTNDVETTHEFVSQVTQTDGKVSVSYTQPVSADVLYKTGEEDTVQSKIDTIETTLAAKSDSGHEHSSYVNQNAFSNIKVGSTTVAADTATDTVEFSGSNVSITANATNDKITFSVAEATSTAKGLVTLGASGGAAEYDTVDTLENSVAAVEANYVRIADNCLYAGKEGEAVIIFDCGTAASWISS